MNAFGRYEIVRRIGVGGMGEVFFAWAYGVARTRKPVVVKVLRSEMLAEPGAPEMFVEEGRLSLHLSHSNIVSVFDFGKADDRYFMAMEYIDGQHVGELRKRAGGRLSPDHAAFVAMEVCLALDYAHRLRDEAGKPLQIVHRDVTPSNILISREGEVKLADFGIARAVGRSQHTQAGQIRGKVRYMSPEAARGEPLDHRADLFSLGVILFELLTGRRAFDAKGGREAILKQIVSGRAPAPSMAGNGVHPALDAVVLRSTSPNRDERFPDAFAMHRAIEEACADAGLRPSRGSFLEFLRGLDSAAGEGGSWASGSVPADPPGRPAAAPLAAEPPVPPLTPSGRPSMGEGAGTAAVAPPPIAGTVGGDGVIPSNARSMPTVTPSGRSKPSSTSGTIPPVIEGPQSTVLPTGVASPVLFTLVMGEHTPAHVNELPVFEVTREGVPLDLDLLPQAPLPPEEEEPPRSGSGSARDVLPARSASAEPTIPPIGMVSDAPTVANTTPARPSPSRRVSVERVSVSDSRPADERPTAPNRERPPSPRDAPTEGAIARPPIDRLTPSSAAETVVGMRPPVDRLTPSTGAETVLAPPPVEPSGPRSDPTVSPSYRAPSGGYVEQVEDPHWRVRRGGARAPVAPPTSFFEDRRRVLPTLGAIGGIVAILLLGIILGRGGSGGTDPRLITTATPVAIASAHAGRETAAPATRTPVVAPSVEPPTRTPPPPTLPPATPNPTRAIAAPTPRVIRTPRPTPTPHPAAPGTLVLNTQPWTEFTIAGRHLHTPLTGERLPPGHYSIALHSRFNPKLDRTIEVDVRSGETTRVLLDLTRP